MGGVPKPVPNAFDASRDLSLGRARTALNQNLEHHVSRTQLPALYNLNVALLCIVDALDEIQRDQILTTNRLAAVLNAVKVDRY
jgi:hypothetical protein